MQICQCIGHVRATFDLDFARCRYRLAAKYQSAIQIGNFSIIVARTFYREALMYLNVFAGGMIPFGEFAEL